MESRHTSLRRVTLILDTANALHREIVAGIGDYMRQQAPDWQLGIVPDVAHAPSVLAASGGVIGDIDLAPPAILRPLLGKTPLVYVSSAESSVAPPGIPTVGIDNAALVESALEHLRSCGLDRFAYYGRSNDSHRPWARARRDAFEVMTRDSGASVGIYAASNSALDDLGEAEMLIEWLKTLPPRIGVLAANDVCARELLHACNTLRRAVPDDIAVISLSHDPLISALSPLTISSVALNTQEIGVKAAELLHRKMLGRLVRGQQHLVNRASLEIAATSPGHKALPLLRKAQHFIAAHAARGIKAAQVADHCGVSRSTLERLFSSLIGRTIHDEILAARLLMAKRMLAEQTLGIAEIARRCGFRTHQYMHVVFRRELGCTPTDFASSSAQKQYPGAIE